MATDQKEAKLARRRRVRSADNEIGEIGEVELPELREAVSSSLQLFLVEFFGDELFFDPFGEVQIASIDHEQRILERGYGKLNKLEPRGFGKTTRSALAAVWACLTGKQNFVMVCCDSVEKSTDILRLCHHALGENEKMLQCFPELKSFHELNGNVHKCQYQTYLGETTKVSIKGDTIYFPRLDGTYPSEQAMIVARPYMKARGKNIEGRRPSVIILDDVQSTEEASSPTSIRKNMKTLTSDIAFLGTRKRPCAIINNATVIENGDFPSLVAQMSSFTTVRYKMVKTFPENKQLWKEYEQIRSAFDPDIVGDDERTKKASLEFYKSNREEMDRGSSVTWDYAFAPAEYQISTIQAAMDFISDLGEDSFLSECQNEPAAKTSDRDFLTAEAICAKQHVYGEGTIPPSATKLIAYIDVQMEVMFYEIWAFSDGFDGFKVTDGIFPDQGAKYFTKSKLKSIFSKIYPHVSLDGRIRQALLDLTNVILSREFQRTDGVKMSVDMCGVDSRYETDAIRQAYKDSPHKARLQLCMGYGIGAKRMPMRAKKPKVDSGEKKGYGWLLGAAIGGVQSLQIDTNLLKTFFHKRMATEIGDAGCFSLYKVESPNDHLLAAHHYKSEYRTTLEGPFGLVDEWDILPGNDNDYFDCAVGCCAIASYLGIAMDGTKEREEKARRKQVSGTQYGRRRQ